MKKKVAKIISIERDSLITLIDLAMWAAYGVDHTHNVKEQHNTIIANILAVYVDKEV